MPKNTRTLSAVLTAALAVSVCHGTRAADAPTPAPVAGPAAYPPVVLPDTTAWGRNVQRTMRLLATSTPERRNTVRVLFYGQSITEQAWSDAVAADLRRRFPHADLVVENRALGGYASQLLVKTAETDLYPFYPDLVVFHVYGAHDKYEDILRRTRERTTAEILQQNDHLSRTHAVDEETDPAKLRPNAGNWHGFMNHNWLPSLARKYRTEYCDQRATWKRYLVEHKLSPGDLLRDDVHLNAHGEFVMAEAVKAHLRYDPKLGPSPAEEWVQTLEVGTAVRWDGGKLRVEFEGNRVDVVLKPGATNYKPLAVRIDGKRPSAVPALYGFTRARAEPGGKWPAVAGLSSEATPRLERWTMEVRADPAKPDAYTFDLTGSEAGPDGSGRSDERFVSRSGRVVIAPEAWDVKYAMALAGVKPVPERFTVRWQVVPRFADEVTAPAATSARGAETTVTVAEGLANGKHVLELSADGEGAAAAVAAVRVYRPPLGRE